MVLEFNLIFHLNETFGRKSGNIYVLKKILSVEGIWKLTESSLSRREFIGSCKRNLLKSWKDADFSLTY